MRFLLTLFFFGLLASCHTKTSVDLLIYNATIYTVDSNFSKVSAIAIKDGKILAVGDSKELQHAYVGAKNINAQGKFIYPGFIDAHAHFLAYGQNLKQVNLEGTKSWNAILKKLLDYKNKRAANDTGWIIGAGWDQNDWAVKEFPEKSGLDSLFPDNPVLLSRIDGHAVIANQKALDRAGIQPGDSIAGGQILSKDSMLTGVLIDNATSLVYNQIPMPTVKEATQALQAAEQNCFAAGLTSIEDMAEDSLLIPLLDSLQNTGALKIRLYVLLSDKKSNFDFLLKHGKIKTDRLHIPGFKVFADGALGSRGACLLQPYADDSTDYGFLLSPLRHYDSVTQFIYKHNFQIATHAIGDSAVRTILKVYAKYLKGPNDRRWRIEHAQIVAPEDLHYFKDYKIIPSVQPTHATSDMYWAEQRLGPERIKNAYINKELLGQNGFIPLGTDFPVEDISPVKTFYAAVFRRDASGLPKKGFQMENALTRQEALKGITIWAAKASFEDKEKGSIEVGKWADFVVTDKDLMQAEMKDILRTRILMTFVGGEKVYDRSGRPILQ
ncbi:amidohydrolase [Arachidicoccus terrestris]|uniref:amidohydrolase n=1 Tax=Arachidicoccus terrestris TaxID=2875539 RepID=UPI001CC54841|nr:amidohydrolase [Arachidicoccus terrestris]UAY55124.1 amidohydrolase family protein [Arachidicoccus terrestris]